MSEQKFYKIDTNRDDIFNDVIEATSEDLEKAGYVKREKVRPIYTKVKRKSTTFIGNYGSVCQNYLGKEWVRCPSCGSELIWTE